MSMKKQNNNNKYNNNESVLSSSSVKYYHNNKNKHYYNKKNDNVKWEAKRWLKSALRMNDGYNNSDNSDSEECKYNTR